MQDASSVKTKKLYDESAYASVFDAVIVSISGNDVVLDQTLFFPEEGGQSCDHGRLGDYSVVDVQIKDGEIHHFIKASDGNEQVGLSVGDRLHGEIDFAERFSNMQQHSGEHILSGIVHKKFGYDNVGFHLSASEVTLDFNGTFSVEDLKEIEKEANRVIVSNLETQIQFTTPEERAAIEYRSKLDLEGEVRLVSFPGVDICACCAPHVKRTGEIGFLKIINAIKYKGGTRISILCGERALNYLGNEHDLITETANFLTTSTTEVPGLVRKMKDDLRDMKAAVSTAAAKLLDYEIAAIPEEEKHALIFAESLSMDDARKAVNKMTALHEGYCGTFIGDDEKGYSFIVGSAGADCRLLMNEFKSGGNARGGGKPEMIQGFIAAKEAEIREISLFGKR